MKRLVVDGNSVYEIDEDCVRHRHPPKDCEIYQHLSNTISEDDKMQKKQPQKKQDR